MAVSDPFAPDTNASRAGSLFFTTMFLSEMILKVCAAHHAAHGMADVRRYSMRRVLLSAGRPTGLLR